MSPNQKRRFWPISLLLGCGVALLAGAAQRGVWIYGDDLLVFQAAQGLLERGDLSVTAPSDGNPVARSVVGIDGKRYAKYGPGLSILAAPFVALGDSSWIQAWKLREARDEDGNLRAGAQVWSAGLLGSFALGLLAVATFQLSVKWGLSFKEAWIGAFLAALASPVAHLGLGLLSEPVSAGLLTLTLVLSLAQEPKTPSKERTAWILMGFAFGAALTVRVFHLVLLPSILLLVLHPNNRQKSLISSPERLFWALLGPGFALGFLAWLNFVRFGNPLETGYGSEASRFDGPLLQGLLGLTVSWGKGLLWHWPALLLAIGGWRAFRQAQPAHADAISCGCLILLFASAKFYQWHGGGVWGPRFLTPLVGWLAVPAAFGWKGLGSRLFRRLFRGFLVLTSLGLAWLPQVVPFERHVLKPIVSEPWRLSPGEWELRSAPWVRAAAELPEAIFQTGHRLLGIKLRRALPKGPEELQAPDFAFVRYRSRPLKKWTQRCLILGGLALGASYVWVSRKVRPGLRS